MTPREPTEPDIGPAPEPCEWCSTEHCIHCHCDDCEAEDRLDAQID